MGQNVGKTHSQGAREGSLRSQPVCLNGVRVEPSKITQTTKPQDKAQWLSPKPHQIDSVTLGSSREGNQMHPTKSILKIRGSGGPKCRNDTPFLCPFGCFRKLCPYDALKIHFLRVCYEGVHSIQKNAGEMNRKQTRLLMSTNKTELCIFIYIHILRHAFTLSKWPRAISR